MPSFRIEWKRSAQKELRKLPKTVVLKLVTLIEELSHNPHPSNSRKILGAQLTYRIRSGNYRIVYSIHAGKLIIEIVKVGHRKNIYKNLT